MSLIGRVATGTVYQLNTFIAIKIACAGEDQQVDHANEQEMFQILGNRSPIPDLIRCYFQRSNDIFLDLVSNGECCNAAQPVPEAR